MKYNAIFSHASRLPQSGNRFILAPLPTLPTELEKVGLSDIAPSRGILVQLLACKPAT